MRRVIWALCALVMARSVCSGQVIDPPARFELDAVSVAQVMRLVYGEVLRSPYVLDPAVVGDARLVSFRWDSESGDLRAFMRSFLDALGYSAEMRGGAEFVSPKLSDEKRQQLLAREAFVYRPRYRDGAYLMDLLAPLFKGSFTARRGVQAPPGAKADEKATPPGSAASLIDRVADQLVFNGSQAEIEKLQRILGQVDTAVGEVLVRGVVFEVQTARSDATAFHLVASLLGGRFGVTYGVLQTENAMRFTGLGLDAVYSALATDTRFKVVSSPSVRVRSGATARVVVGQDVPVLGAVSYPQGAAQAVQAVEYRSSGVILELSPKVRETVVDCDINQQVSSFVQTNTGVNNSPTLIKREVHTSVSMADGDLIVMAGLTEDKDTEGARGLTFLPSWMRSKTSDVSRTELLLVLQLERLAVGR